MSDPPSCTNTIQHAYVTITGVLAHTSASAGANDAGWQNLTTQLSLNSPVQLDLLNLSGNSPQPILCLLKTLGSNQSLPVGSYQQIRLLLADNGSNSPTISGNPCVTAGLPSGTVNCIEDASNSWFPLELSSQDQTGLKIPPGQIVGGPIDVAAGQSVDININFNTCDSLVFDHGQNAYRLKPTLTASQVSPNTSGISGAVVSASSTTAMNPTVTAISPLADATVKLELHNGPMDSVNSANTNSVFDTAVTDASGNFDFCPVTQTATFDVVADAPAPTGGTPVAVSGGTIIENVPNGAAVTVPVVTEGGTPTSPGTMSVTLTPTVATGNMATFTVDLELLPLQFTAPGGYEFIVPRLNGSTAMPVEVNCASGVCTVSPAAPASVLVPATSPLVGSYSGGTITWLSGPVFTGGTPSTGMFAIEANSSTGNDPMHTCDVAFSKQATVTAGATTLVTLSLTNCQ